MAKEICNPTGRPIMPISQIEIDCPKCGGRVCFHFTYIDTDDINVESAQCDICHKKIVAVLEFEDGE